jgi:hypothetical protein
LKAKRKMNRIFGWKDPHKAPVEGHFDIALQVDDESLRRGGEEYITIHFPSKTED